MGAPSAPFCLGDGPDVCLLLHGLTGTPAEVRPVGEALAAAGFRAVGPLLPGHGTTPEDLATVTHRDLLEAALRELLALAGARRVYLCGLSAGALLSVQLAARSYIREGLPDFSAMALLAPAVDFAGLTRVFTEVIGRLPALPFVVGKAGRDIQSKTYERADGAYEAIPLRWGRELRQLRDEAMRLAPRVHAPTLLLHGARDRTVRPSGAFRLARELPSSEVRILPQSGHVLPLDLESDAVCAAVRDFFLARRG